MSRVFNFSAGPSQMPLEVLREIQNDLLDYKGIGYSILEMNHRTDAYYSINDEAKRLVLKLLNLDDTYEVLFVSGGGTSQFSMIPMNLANKNDICYYTISGHFSNKAYEEGKKYVDAKVLASSKESSYNHIEKIDVNKIDKKAKYIHITVNNTVPGTTYNVLPETNGVVLVGDISSIIFAKNYDYKKFGLVYAGVQKNLGAAGATVVVVKKDLIRPMEQLESYVPSMYVYENHSKANSIYNTPPVFSIYVIGLMCKWIESCGGVDELEKRALKKSGMIYDIIDNSSFYKGIVINKEDRSPVNVTFITPNEDLNKKFIEEAKKEGMINLKGHKAMGGIRASLYNAMPMEGVAKLSTFMEKFEKNNK